MTFYHGGKAGLKEGERLEAAPTHVSDGCYLCVARESGRSVTVGEWRGYLVTRAAAGDQGAARVLAILHEEDAPLDTVLDPPSERSAVYMTSSLDYATWYAARSKGDLYEVEPQGSIEKSETDHFPSWTAEGAIVTKVLRRGVRLDRRERRRIARLWKRADKAAIAIPEVAI